MNLWKFEKIKIIWENEFEINMIYRPKFILLSFKLILKVKKYDFVQFKNNKS